MSEKKYLAWFYDFSYEKNYNQFIHGQSFLINKFNENFDKIFLINIQGLKFFQKSKFFQFDSDKHIQLPNNFEFINPQNINEFKNFIINKKLIGIKSFNNDLSGTKINFLLKRYKVELIQIANIGNVQFGPKIISGTILKGVYHKLNKIFFHKLNVLLSNLNLVPKIEIKFLTNSKIFKITQKKNIFNNMKFSIVKKHLLINSNAFDLLKEQKIKLHENKIVLLDEMLNADEYKKFGKETDEKKIEIHYLNLNKILKNLSKTYRKDVVICLHPKDNMDIKKKYFPNFELVQFKTKEMIFEAFLVLFFESSAIIDAILVKKRIVTLVSNALDKNQIDYSQHYIKQVGINKIDIDKKFLINEDEFLIKLNNAKKNYTNYIESYIVCDGDNLGYKKIINTVKERFFK